MRYTTKNIYNSNNIKTGIIFVITPKTLIPTLCRKDFWDKNTHKRDSNLYIDYVTGYKTFQYDLDFEIYLQKTGKIYTVNIGGRLTYFRYKTIQEFCDNFLKDIDRDFSQYQLEMCKKYDEQLSIMIAQNNTLENPLPIRKFNKLVND